MVPDGQKVRRDGMNGMDKMDGLTMPKLYPFDLVGE